ncbi:hypothetical protein QQ045_022190 [Rhodiola kirilowii]
MDTSSSFVITPISGGSNVSPTVNDDPYAVNNNEITSNSLVSELLASVSLIVHGQILNAKDVATAWKILHTRYAGSNVSRKFAWKRDLGNMKQSALDLAHYYDKLAKYWEELADISGVTYMNFLVGDKCENVLKRKLKGMRTKSFSFLWD